MAAMTLVLSEQLSLNDEKREVLVDQDRLQLFGDGLAFSDAFVSQTDVSRGTLFENFTISDEIVARLATLLTASDSIALSDAVTIVLATLITFTESLSLSDAISTNFATQLTATISEAMTLSDAASVFNSTSDLEYLRKYLHDVPR